MRKSLLNPPVKLYQIQIDQMARMAVGVGVLVTVAQAMPVPIMKLRPEHQYVWLPLNRWRYRKLL